MLSLLLQKTKMTAGQNIHILNVLLLQDEVSICVLN